MSETKFQGLLFGVRRSIRYHLRRRSFFDRLSRFSTFLTALAGTATVVSVLGKAGYGWIIALSVAVAVFSVIDLVVGSAQSARLHHDLARRFIDLEKDMVLMKYPTMEQIDNMTGRRLDIEADEPPPLKVLDCICHNELMRAMGYAEAKFSRIRWYQRLFSQLFDIREHSIVTQTVSNR